jgi:predicted RNA-binding Zn-ribbon protein involved in translation (DUF1610 family)
MAVMKTSTPEQEHEASGSSDSQVEWQPDALPPPRNVRRTVPPKEQAEEIWERYHEENPNVSKEMFMKVINAPKCPMCGGPMYRMDAGAMGTAFAEGSLFGAFTKTYRCNLCGYLT